MAKKNYGESAVQARHRLDTDDRDPENATQFCVNGERVRTNLEIQSQKETIEKFFEGLTRKP